MQRYEKYKDSGIEWLGEIPEHWEVKKITHLFKKIGSGTTPTAGSALYYNNGIINFLQTGDLNDNYIFSTSKKITERAFLDYSSLKIFPVGSLVIAMYGATIGKLGILKIEATTNQACCVLGEWQIDLDLKYIFYWFIFAKNQILSMSYGGGQPNISQDLIKSLRVHFPPFHEQKAITKFLDDKCEKIDAAVNLKEQQIEKLRELRQITIHNAVTKGIRHSKGEVVPMKNSGIEWIGKVPEDWEVKRLKNVFDKIQTGTTPPTTNQLYFDGKISWYNPKDLNNEILLKSEKNVAQKAVSDKVIKLFDGDSVLIVGIGATAGKTSYLKEVATFNQQITGFKSYKNNNKYYFYLFKNLSTIFLSLAQFTTLPILNNEFFKKFQLPIPPISEQKEIVAYLEEQTSKIDKAIAQKQEQIAKLKEYKQSLINEVVTGKLKVVD